MTDILAQHRKHVEDADSKAQVISANFAPPSSPAEWHKRKHLVFDLESTGPDPLEARIVTASILEVFGNPFSAESVVVREWMANPGVEIPMGAQRVHGISTERAAAEGLPLEVVVREVVDILRSHMQAGVPVLAYNASYDFTVLDRECRRLGIEPLTEEEIIIIDPLVLDYKFDKYRSGSRKLADVAAFYGVAGFNAHDSSADCLATSQLAYTMAQHFYPSNILLAPETLHSVQKNWKKAWADGRNQWAVSKNKIPNYNPHLGPIPL